MSNSTLENFKEKIGLVNWNKLEERLSEVNYHIKSRGIVNDITAGYGGIEMLTGYSYGEFYDWDLYFENIYMSYYGISKFCRNNIEAFLDTQLNNGFISRSIKLPRMKQHFKPFIAQTVLLGCKQSDNFIWLKDKYYTKIKKYLEYWFWYCDFDKNGLCVWDSADHSGMDNQNLRAGKMYSMEIEGVDLNCYLVRELQAMAIIGEKLGHMDDSQEFKNHAEKLSKLINEIFWDEKDGFYYDRNERKNELVRIKSIAGFLPLWLGIVPKDKAERMIKEHLLNKDEFWLEYPLASWAKNEEGYYQTRTANECNWMGTCWIPTNYMVFHGLLNYGYVDIARELSNKTFNMVLAEADTREYYNAETGCGQGINPFWGWSTLAYFMPLELEMEYDPTSLGCDIIIPIGKKILNILF